jgi:phage tail-like protein
MVASGNVKGARSECLLSISYTDGTEAAAWKLKNAWPSAYSASNLTEMNNAAFLLTETLSIVYESITRTK